METFYCETDAISSYNSRISALENNAAASQWVLYKTATGINYSGNVNVSNYYQASTKIAKLSFTGTSIDTRSRVITINGFIRPTSEIQIGVGYNYKDSTNYYAVLRTDGTMYIPGTYYACSLNASEFSYLYNTL